MGNQAGGNTRFKGPGSLWKSSWKRRPLLSQLCCVEGFAADLAGQFYVNDNGPLDIVPANGWWMGVVVNIPDQLTATQLIARNGNVANEGWRLTAFDQLTSSGDPGVGFNFSVFDGAGVAAAAITNAGLPLYTEDLKQLLGDSQLFTVMMGFEPPSTLLPDGAIAINVDVGGVASLSAPYVNTDPRLFVGRENLDVLEAPNCLAGIVGGRAQFGPGSIAASVQLLRDSWISTIEAAGQITEVVNNTAAANFANENGWRIEGNLGAGSDTPNPLPDFIDAEPLDYGNAQPIARSLTIGCLSPIIADGLPDYPFINF